MLPTKKGGDERILILSIKDTPFLDIIVSYLDAIPLPEFKLFPHWTTPKNFNYILNKLKDRYEEKYGERLLLAPYVFRKFRDSDIWSKGATSQEIMAWRGTKSIRVFEEHYAMLKPVSKFKKMVK
jgi:hypothetical protein